MYRVTCPACSTPYDATRATVCHCLNATRSFVCPACGACFCSAPKSFQDRFWRDAPRELWERRRRGAGPVDEEPQEIDASRPVVLFADDDPTARRIAQQVIGALGCTVYLASDGDQLLQRAREVKPALVITDALMPRRDGREAARILKEEMPQTRVVVITSIYKDPRYKHEAYRHFLVDEYLTKPVAPGVLRDVVQRLVLGQGATP